MAVKTGFLLCCALTFFLKSTETFTFHHDELAMLSNYLRLNSFCSVDALPKIQPLCKLIFTALSLNNAMVHVLSSGTKHKLGSLARSVHFILKTQVELNLRQHPHLYLIIILFLQLPLAFSQNGNVFLTVNSAQHSLGFLAWFLLLVSALDWKILLSFYTYYWDTMQRLLCEAHK